MKTITHEIEIRKDGIRIVRNFFVHPKAIDWFGEISKDFTKDQRKQARLQHKQYLRSLS